MSLATLSDVLQPALSGRYAVAGLVTQGWEDMRAFVEAAELEGCPVILQAGPACRAHIPLPILGKMFRHLAEQAGVPVVAHLDHGHTFEECRTALDCGFTSVMYDGSRKQLSQNIDETAAIADLAHRAGMSCEGEIGFVGYAGAEMSEGTDPGEAARFARETGVDAMAVSVGNVHLQQKPEGAGIDEALVARISAATSVPLVIHGGSGVSPARRTALARGTNICKFNIGTELRMAFGAALRAAIASDVNRFDRIGIMSDIHAPLVNATREVLRALKPEPESGKKPLG